MSQTGQPGQSGLLRRRILFHAIPVGMLLAFVAAGMASGTFDTYRARYDFATSVQTLIFATYLFALLPTLLLTPLILKKITPIQLYLIGICVLVVADVVFVSSAGTWMLFLGRALQGITVAFLNSAAPQLLISLQKRGWGRFDAMILSLVASGGLGVGLFGAKALEGSADNIDRWLFAIHIVMTIVFLVGTQVIRPRGEDAKRKVGDSAEEKQNLFDFSAPKELHAKWISTAGLAAGTVWTLGGLYLGLGGLIGDTVAPPIAAFVPFIFFMAMMGGQLLTRTMSKSISQLLIWIPVNVAGAILTAAGVGIAFAAGEASWFSGIVGLAGAMAGGVSLGIIFVVATDIFPKTIDDDKASKQTAFFFAKTFAGNSLPTLAVGLLSDVIGLQWALAILAAVVTVMGIGLIVRFRSLALENRRVAAQQGD